MKGKIKTKGIRRARGIRGSKERPRLSVYRSIKNISAQIIDDESSRTLASASSIKLKIYGGNIKAAEEVGKNIAKEAMSKNINCVVFDRREYRYHGRIKALADAARKVGLKF